MSIIQINSLSFTYEGRYRVDRIGVRNLPLSDCDVPAGSRRRGRTAASFT